MGYNAKWSDAEDDQLRAGVRVLPGRTQAALFHRLDQLKLCRRHGVPRGSVRRAWTAPELLLVIAGVRAIEGRTPKAVEVVVTRLGIGLMSDLPGAWSTQEIALLRSGELPEGRTLKSAKIKAQRLGFGFKAKTAAKPRNAPSKGFSASVLHTANATSSGYNLLAEILKEVGHGLPQHLKDEIVAEACCLALGEGLSAAEAVKRARPAARKFEQNPKHKQLDDCFWL